jgi:hypothetical protein
VVALDRDHRLKGRQRLDRSLEADRSWADTVFDGGLGHDGSDEVVAQQVRPDFFADEFRCFAPQDLLERPAAGQAVMDKRMAHDDWSEHGQEAGSYQNGRGPACGIEIACVTAPAPGTQRCANRPTESGHRGGFRGGGIIESSRDGRQGCKPGSPNSGPGALLRSRLPRRAPGLAPTTWSRASWSR